MNIVNTHDTFYTPFYVDIDIKIINLLDLEIDLPILVRLNRYYNYLINENKLYGEFKSFMNEKRDMKNINTFILIC